MRTILTLTLAIAPLAIGSLSAKNDENVKRLKTAVVFSEIMATPNKGIPQDLLADADCIVMVPGLKTAAFLVAGLALEGATLRQDRDENAELYGKRLENRGIVTTSVRIPSPAARLISLLDKYSARERPNIVTGAGQ